MVSPIVTAVEVYMTLVQHEKRGSRDRAAAKAPEAEGLHGTLDNVQHLLRLREE